MENRFPVSHPPPPPPHSPTPSLTHLIPSSTSRVKGPSVVDRRRPSLHYRLSCFGASFAPITSSNKGKLTPLGATSTGDTHPAPPATGGGQAAGLRGLGHTGGGAPQKVGPQNQTFNILEIKPLRFSKCGLNVIFTKPIQIVCVTLLQCRPLEI